MFSQSESESALGNDSGIKTFSSSVLAASWRDVRERRFNHNRWDAAMDLVPFPVRGKR